MVVLELIYIATNNSFRAIIFLYNFYKKIQGCCDVGFLSYVCDEANYSVYYLRVDCKNCLEFRLGSVQICNIFIILIFCISIIFLKKDFIYNLENKKI